MNHVLCFVDYFYSLINLFSSQYRKLFTSKSFKKGYLWQGNSHDLIGYISTAGNLSRIESPGRWNCLQPQSYQGTPDEQAANRKKYHWEEVYGDRRQELVFIGQDLNHLKIQELLDDCLLSDAQMTLGPDGWKATFGDVILDEQ